MIIKQLKTGFDNFSYIVYDSSNDCAAIVDPGVDAKHTISFLKKHSLAPDYLINTHYHSDHTGCNNKIKKCYPQVKIVASEFDGKKIKPVADVFVSDNEILELGKIVLRVIQTPGHTRGGICIVVDDRAIFTGDTLFIGDCGRADLSDGDLREMFNSLQRIKALSDDLVVYPGHDYGDKPFDTLGLQKKTNKVLVVKTFREFLKLV